MPAFGNLACGIFRESSRSSQPPPISADPWPQWRGPAGQGHAEAAHDLPVTWSETENVRWKTPLPGRGWSSPVVGGGLGAGREAEAVRQEAAADREGGGSARQGGRSAAAIRRGEAAIGQGLDHAAQACRQGDPPWRPQARRRQTPSGRPRPAVAVASCDPESPGSRRGVCDCKCTEPAGCESLPVAGLAAVTDRNCVPVRGGGEHQEVNDESVG